MTLPFDPSRHEPLRELKWDPARVREAIAEICADAEEAFDPETLWPGHPRDLESDSPEDGILRSLYFGAAGMVHGLSRLARAGLCEMPLDLAAIVRDLPAAVVAQPDELGAGPSLLLGPTGILLVAHAVAPSSESADALAALIAANVEHPSNEMLLGAPGTMRAARAMYGRTGEQRFAELWRASATVLLARQDADGLWTQDLYGERIRYVGPGHGFAGNVAELLAARDWLADPAAVEARALAVVRELAITEDDLATWLPLAPRPGSGDGGPPRVQWCHGAPGMIISLGGLGLTDNRHDELLRAGGEFVWRVGPIAANAGLCHGTAGNAFAFLALLGRTGDELWLDRARRFAMHALDQVARWRAQEGRGRYSLFTGDMGPALLAAACFDGEAGLPGLDDL